MASSTMLAMASPMGFIDAEVQLLGAADDTTTTMTGTTTTAAAAAAASKIPISSHHHNRPANNDDDGEQPPQLPPSPELEHVSGLHAHRQSHNSSKLPAFRFADRPRLSLGATGVVGVAGGGSSSVAQQQEHQQQQHQNPAQNMSPALQLQQLQPVHGHQRQQHQNRQSQIAPQTIPLPLSPAATGEGFQFQFFPDSTAAHVDSTQTSTSRPRSSQPESNHHLQKQRQPDGNDPFPAAGRPGASTTPKPTENSLSLQSLSALAPDIPQAIQIDQLPTNTPPPPPPPQYTPPPPPPQSTIAKRPVSFPIDIAAVVRPSSKTPPVAISTLQGPTSHHRHSDAASSDPGPTFSIAEPSPVNEQHAPATVNTATPIVFKAGKGDLQLPKTRDQSQADDRPRFKSRPPISYKPLRSEIPGVRVPPIRSFRSSGSRKSWSLEIPAKSMRSPNDEGSSADEQTDPDHHDRTLWALEGRNSAGGPYSQMTPPDSADATPDADNTADIFMKIAGEDVSRANPEDDRRVNDSAASRLVRSSHRRPLSAAVPSSFAPSSPPQVTRRLSDQRETSRFKRAASDHPLQQSSRDSSQRVSSKDRAVDDMQPRSRASGPPVSLKSSPMTPRSPTTQEFADSFFPYKRRRPSLTDSVAMPSRASAKHSYANSRTFNPSPLVPRHPDQNEALPGPGQEGNESSASAAPSTVWDEIDDIRTRIHRLELTGKPPNASGAPASRVSDERPHTATTNATTVSGSPKRSGNPAADASSTTSSQREAQPILVSAMAKCKPFIGTDAFGALEAAASQAMMLSQMMGVAGQPGPVSSGASTIGGTMAAVTDRQLRRKTEDICRNLTELCLALADEGMQRRVLPSILPSIENPPSREPRAASSSPTRNPVAVAANQRRAAVAADAGLSRLNTTLSPRASRTDERIANLMSSGALSSPRFALSPATASIEPTTTVAGRRSSLLISRTRRAGTEEPEDLGAGRKSSLFTRTRRAGTEEPPDEGRKTSMLLHSQRPPPQPQVEDEPPRFRAPSRATTELGSLRPAPRDYVGQQRQLLSQPQQQPQQSEAATILDPSSPQSSALPRRRLVPSSLSSRLATPSAPLSSMGRRYLDRAMPEREGPPVALDNIKMADERGQRQFSLGPTMLTRTNSLGRRRETGIPSFTGPSGSASNVGGYR